MACGWRAAAGRGAGAAGRGAAGRCGAGAACGRWGLSGRWTGRSGGATCGRCWGACGRGLRAALGGRGRGALRGRACGGLGCGRCCGHCGAGCGAGGRGPRALRALRGLTLRRACPGGRGAAAAGRRRARGKRPGRHWRRPGRRPGGRAGSSSLPWWCVLQGEECTLGGWYSRSPRRRGSRVCGVRLSLPSRNPAPGGVARCVAWLDHRPPRPGSAPGVRTPWVARAHRGRCARPRTVCVRARPLRTGATGEPHAPQARRRRGRRPGAARRQGRAARGGVDRAHRGAGGPVPRRAAPDPQLRRRRSRRRAAARHPGVARAATRQVQPGLRAAARAAAGARGRQDRLHGRARGWPSPSRSSCSTRRTWPTRRARPRRSAGASRSARRVAVAELEPVDLVVTGCVAVGADGARLGKGGGFADLEFALATAAGLIGPATLVVTTVHELQVRPAGADPDDRPRRPRRPRRHPRAGDRLPAARAARARPTGSAGRS